ncbi:hypothetical protein GEMRC1_008546 [Eukaryota sp. GEM-RC1]
MATNHLRRIKDSRDQKQHELLSSIHSTQKQLETAKEERRKARHRLAETQSKYRLQEETLVTQKFQRETHIACALNEVEEVVEQIREDDKLKTLKRQDCLKEERRRRSQKLKEAKDKGENVYMVEREMDVQRSQGKKRHHCNQKLKKGSKRVCDEVEKEFCQIFKELGCVYEDRINRLKQKQQENLKKVQKLDNCSSLVVDVFEKKPFSQVNRPKNHNPH